MAGARAKNVPFDLDLRNEAYLLGNCKSTSPRQTSVRALVLVYRLIVESDLVLLPVLASPLLANNSTLRSAIHQARLRNRLWNKEQ